ncbi:MAG TPA: dUTP diphosphatase [bacterium]|nr:MAG: Deoxyuridine 5'-triphosphate nucleotidohydrolase [Parcubacteria group bacterium ADurb.Bin115]HNU81257.1 dUTP diphosphatase [bacterium]HPW05535.1 dUTP diphosphatase [bacterium]HPY99220.1 dUTP diphosphatase [bacterium]HQB76378.1 dUTP diphosphatase [bacterium]
MSNYSGKFIVIDGTDGTGKTTQLQILANRLHHEGYEVELADFPQYNTKSAGMVEEYLSGKYGEANDVNPYAASLFYSVDRFDASFKIREWLEQGKVVICNRYISASFAHQGNKIKNALERKLFYNWLSEIEYKVFNIPKPDLYLILYMEPEISQKLAHNRRREDWKGKTKDIHEDNLQHLRQAAQTYLEIAQEMPDFRLIRCTRKQEILKREDIHYLIWLYVNRILNSDQTTPKTPDLQALNDILINKSKLTPNLPELIDVPRLSISAAASVLGESPTLGLPAHSDKDESPAIADKGINRLMVERLLPEAKLPERAHPYDAGLDLFAAEDCSIPPYGQDLIPTGIRLAIPDGYVGLIWDKSGLASQGFTTMGGVIDSRYRGEIKVIFKNLSEDIYHIQAGQKIAQLLIQKIELPDVQAGKIEDDSQRGGGGFGSTGLF